MNRHIYVSGLFNMPQHVRDLQPSHLVSIIQPELQPERPPGIAVDRHLRVGVHDISEPDGYGVLVRPDDVHDLLAFANSWNPDEGDLLIHCYAGISRSTAAALIAHFLKTGDPEASTTALRQAAPYAAPNRRIISLADSELGLGGALVGARDRMGPPDWPLLEEPLATLMV